MFSCLPNTHTHIDSSSERHGVSYFIKIIKIIVHSSDSRREGVSRHEV